MKRVGFDWIARGLTRHPEIMTLSGGSLCPADFPAMVGVIRHPDAGVLLFDTGYDPAFLTATRPWPERLYRIATPVDFAGGEDWSAWLAANGVSAADITGVILSHFHGDHVAGLHQMPDAPIHCARAGLENLRQGSRLRRVTQGLLGALAPPDTESRARFFEDAPAVPLPGAFAPFSEGRDILGDGSLLAVELPGHCKGHWGLAFRDQKDRYVLLAADAVWSGKAIAQCRPPPRITTALLGDTGVYRQTLLALHQAQARNADLAILPSHCAVSAVAYRQDDVA
ncbi:MAG: MBL fold metallo-hydrolase [Caulobacteraceae bacterium]|nr:MAG: MBL fold metallo-hydrolase [Caulobacteraceae bacterium]